VVTYDADVIQEYAERLYDRADLVVYRETFIGLAIGCVVGFVVGLLLPLTGLTNTLPDQIQLVVAVAGGILGTLVGWAIGNDKAFALRLQAQLALCQAQIERNTRAGATRIS
jgi:NhaP-type Na+/H+ or K+/H+ antiporter